MVKKNVIFISSVLILFLITTPIKANALNFSTWKKNLTTVADTLETRGVGFGYKGASKSIKTYNDLLNVMNV